MIPRSKITEKPLKPYFLAKQRMLSTFQLGFRTGMSTFDASLLENL